MIDLIKSITFLAIWYRILDWLNIGLSSKKVLYFCKQKQRKISKKDFKKELILFKFDWIAKKIKMDDYSEIAFECILQPSVLDTKVFGISTKSDSEDRKTSVGILLELLTQLCSVTKTQIAVNIEGMFCE